MKHVFFLSFFFLFAISGYSKKKELSNTRYQFIANKGQFHENVSFRVDIPNGLLFLENNTFTYHFYDGQLLEELHHGHYKGNTTDLAMRYHAYKVKFENANPNPVIHAQKKASNFYNFYLSNDPSKWASKVPAYGEITYQNLYPGINLKMYKHDYDGLKYDLIVAPHTSAEQVEISYNGVDSIYLKNGKLYVITSLNENWEEKPEAWQIKNGTKQKVACKYRLEGNTLSYYFPNGYDHELELIIDPILIFSSYSGSTSNNFGYTATYDKFGFLYSGSSTFGPGYPPTVGAYETQFKAPTSGTATDMAITKWDTSGTSLIYSTYLGGLSDEVPHSLIVNEYSELYVMGTTGSIDFPTTKESFDTSFNIHSPVIPVTIGGAGVNYANGVDITVSKFDSSGSNLLASTFLGGTNTDGLNTGNTKFNYADEFRGEIDLDKNGKVYVVSCTKSNDNPITSIGFQTTKLQPNSTDLDGIVYKLDQHLHTLEWTNYLGGINDDAAFSIAIDLNNDIYVSGGTESSDFPISNLGYDTSLNGDIDGFVTHISGNGTRLLASTYYGSLNYDQSYFVELDFENNVHLFGQTAAPQGMLIENANYHDSLGGQFIVKFKPALDSIIWSTRFGTGRGVPDISPTAFLVDVCSAIYLSGWGSAVSGSNLTTNGLDTAGSPYQATTDGNDFYIMVLSADANSLQYASFMGGASAAEHVDGGTSRFDRKGKIYQSVCAGCIGLSDFPTYPNPGAWSNTNGIFTGCNLAVFKMDFLLPIVIADFDVPNSGCAPLNFTVDNLSLQQSQTTWLWDFGDGTTSNRFEPNHTYTSPGVYTIKLFVNDAATCNLADSILKTITVLSNTNSVLPNKVSCNQEGIQIGIPQNNDPNLSISWFPTLGLSDTLISNPIANPLTHTLYRLIVDNGICFDTLTQFVEVDTISTLITGVREVCLHDAPFLLNSISHGQVDTYLWSNFANFSDSIPSMGQGESAWVSPIDSVSIYYLRVTSPNGCTATDSFEIILNDLQNPIIASFSYPQEGCAPDVIQFMNTTDSLTSTTYYWDLGNGNNSTLSNPSTVYPQKGTYTITLIATDTSLCPQSDTISQIIRIKSDSNYTVNSIACFGQESEIGIPADTTTGTTYSWMPTTGLSDPNINNPLVTLTSDATYLLVVQHVCTDSVTNIVSVSYTEAETDSLVIICSDNPIVDLKGNSNGTGSKFVWSTASNLSDTLNASLSDSTVSVTQNNAFQFYYFNVENADGCNVLDSIYAVVSDQTVAISADTYICQLDTILLHAVNEFPNNPMSFYWSPASEIIGNIDTTSILVAPIRDTWYYLTAINDSGCTYTDSVNVGVSILNDSVIIASSLDDSVLLGFSTTISVIPNSGFNYSWTPASDFDTPNESTSLVTPTQTTTYTVNVTDPINTSCSYSDIVKLVSYEINCGEPDIFIPNAFSPNLDGENDQYLISGKVIETIELKIYNRWGEMVFETTDPTQAWDGKFNDKFVDPVVFMYHLNVTCIDQRKFQKKGNITVIR